ncbi:MAG TPA: 2-C-methyl-D-erythritol 2,4-cyclodiphosphate synthase [Candidatus Hydrogenedentes bacterium]|nr:2-C-methyl-D-erythritol 2,4-cyclodiphosphate synthase [Candidatus Hydrogenedentota bacterium]
MIRVGLGYDIHGLTEGGFLTLGGVKIPFEKKFLAHSDGDVLCHAVTDALLGAAGLPNIGVVFPDSDMRFKDADSLVLLDEAVRMIRGKGYAPVQMDANIIAQRPRLQSYVNAMRENLAKSLGIALDAVSIKPRTNEGFGAEGRQEAISAQVVVVIGAIIRGE